MTIKEDFAGLYGLLAKKPRKNRGTAVRDRSKTEDAPIAKVDRRSERATGRTEQFGCRIKQETIDTIHALRENHGMTIGAVVERAINALERELAQTE